MSTVGSGPREEAAAEDAELAAGLSAAAGVEATVEHDGAGTPVVQVAPEGWLEAARHARDVLGMDYLDWLSAVDQPDGDPAGVDVVLHVAASASAGEDGESTRYPEYDGPRRVRRLLLRTRVPDSDPTLASLTALWPGVAWHERETFEMFGVVFAGFADGSGHGLRPLLLPEGFEGTPLRKSFVLAARAAKPWPGAKEPGESGEGRSPSRRKLLPPGVPDAGWGPHDPAGDGADGEPG
jgi:NADH-quinone oxidoreductase subunit C